MTAPSLLPYMNPSLSVKFLIDTASHQWNEEEFYELIDKTDHHLIKKIFLLPWQTDDTMIWNPRKDGIYIVKSGYYLANNISLSLAHITPKLQHFLWRVSLKAIGINANLRRRRINVDPLCCRCCITEETSEHMLFSCHYVMTIWRLSGLPMYIISDPILSLEDKLLYLLQHVHNTTLPEEKRYEPVWILW
ncbi:unnamed protein product [Thlaspi arvense]|uniref:Reverse transcriptase zinc-binding domain-containing protein n=1 Tax=Thlaspi arvense TaxID=13288 RepID=A0AAU9SLF9_THLAR|nr:unnamed protein product [Thlaspi arvense]